jgi:hypothetical protein
MRAIAWMAADTLPRLRRPIARRLECLHGHSQWRVRSRQRQQQTCEIMPIGLLLPRVAGVSGKV